MKLNKILSIPRSLFFNIKWFGLGGGVKLPILISNTTKVKVTRGKIILKNPSMCCVQIGFGGSEGVIENKYTSFVNNGGIIVFDGNTKIAQGSSIRVDSSGNLLFGKNFSCNKNCFISCGDCIEIGNDVLLGWNVHIRDNDGHTIYLNGEQKPSSKKVIIGNNVWLASDVVILKGSEISSGCVVGYGSLIASGKYNKENMLLIVHPDTIIDSGITWIH